MMDIVITKSFIKARKLVKYIGLYTLCIMLNGCLGGSIAQQIASSIATRIADKAVANALDVNENSKPKQREITLQDRPPNTLSMAIARTEFKAAPIKSTQVKSTQVKSDQAEQAQLQQKEKTIPILYASSLVSVEIHGLIIGDERDRIYQQARSLGALNLPTESNWANWYVASGKIKESEEVITFLIPPEIGKLPSGSNIIVEKANTGNVNIARYLQDDRRRLHAMDQSTHSASR